MKEILTFVLAMNTNLIVYFYNDGGERTHKLSGEVQYMIINGRPVAYGSLDRSMLYVSPYLVASERGCSKHIYAGTERIASNLNGSLNGINDHIRIRTQDELYEKQAGQLNMISEMNENELPSQSTNLNASWNLLGHLRDNTEHVGKEEVYYYHTDHLGSSSWITYTDGAPVQYMSYMPFGELQIDRRDGNDWNSRYTFSGKERDEETGYSYFGARYYDADLSIWLSRDPLADKYPTLSPYVYCANNPVKYYDPDGRKIVPADKQSAKYMKRYFNEIFGTSKIFGGELKIRNFQYNKFRSFINVNKQILLDSFKEAIQTNKTLQVAIIPDGDSYTFSENIWSFDASGYPTFYDTDYRTLRLGDAAGKTGDVGLTFNIELISDNKGNDESYLTDNTFTLGNLINYNFKNRGRASDVFIHEVLDEFLNIDVKGGRFVRSPINRVYYQNLFLKEKVQKLRNAVDHEQ